MRGGRPPDRSEPRSQRFLNFIRKTRGCRLRGGLVVGAGGLCPEDWVALGGVGLGVVVGKQLSLPRRLRGIDGCAWPRAAGLIEVVPRVHDGGAEAARFVMDFWIREVRGAGAWVDRIGGAGAGVHHDGAGGGGRSVGLRELVGAGEVERGEEGGDLSGFFEESDGAERARAERAFKRIDAPDVFD